MCCGLVAALVAALSGVLVGEPQDANEGITQLKELSVAPTRHARSSDSTHLSIVSLVCRDR